jgi:hypothetical protein
MDGHVLMDRRYRGIALSGVVASTALLAMFLTNGCGSTDCSFTATCAGGTAIPDGGEDAPVVIPADCDLTKSPKESPTCVDDGPGIFVDATKGKPDAKGTKLEPLSTITAAISKAVTTKRSRVYVCDGKYDEAIKITSAVNVYGGFDCTWANTGVKPKITPPKGAAIEVKSVAEQVVIQDVDATGLSDASVKGSSAIGALIVKSKVTLRNVTLTAGPGQDGAKGTSRSNYADAAKPGIKGSGATGGVGGDCTCLDATSSKGGRGADGDATKLSGGVSVPTAGISNAGSSSLQSCGPGQPGANGEPGAAAEPIASPGKLTEMAWDVSKLGEPSLNGHPGQGGGGGGAQTDFNTGGGGGGCGGCGGGGGAAGANGGASIGLVSFEAVVSVDAGSIVAGTGGKGGTGGDGQPGQGGGGGGGSLACAGGVGGSGAGGSGGTGGAGGASIAVAWSGTTEPAVTSTEAKPGTGGEAGTGGSAGAGSGKPGNIGKPGTAGSAMATYRQQ